MKVRLFKKKIKIIYYTIFDTILLFKCSVYDIINEDYKFCFIIYFHKSISKLRKYTKILKLLPML
jgi:hypothetical protein